MSMLITIPVEDNSILLTEADIGRGYNIDEKDGNCIKKHVFEYIKENVISTSSLNDKNNLSVIRSQESVKSELKLTGELGVSLGIISGKVIGNYCDPTKSDTDNLTLLYTRKITSKVIELNPNAKLLEDVQLEDDIDSLRSAYGLFYIRKIEFGAVLNIKITLDSTDEELMKKIKCELNASIDILKLSSTISPYIQNSSNSSSKLNISSSVFMGGCKQVHRTDIQNFNEVICIINSFEVDPERLVPIRIEILPVPIQSNFIEFDKQRFNKYRKKISIVSLYVLELQQILHQLNSFSNSISKINTSDTDIYLKVCHDLLSSISSYIFQIKEKQDKLDGFLQSKIDFIIDEELPYSNEDINEIQTNAQRLMGLTFITTSKGNWFGSSINGLPIYKGTYQYNDGSIYKGVCYNDNRNGEGIMKFIDGNTCQLKSIEGHWKNDELYYPSIINFTGDKISISIDSLKDCNIYKHTYNELIMCKKREPVKIDDQSTLDEHKYRIIVNVDLIQDESFSQFYQKLIRVIDDRKCYYFMFLGMTGTGKTTMVEFILNILAGQVNSPTTLRSVSLENDGIGESKTKSVCRYQIDYVENGALMCSITIIDTPGFADANGIEKDREHIKSILKTVGIIERIDSISYVVNGALTRKTVEPLKVLCNVFSILPNEAFNCVSTFISFCDNSEQANEVRNILNEMLHGIKERPAIFVDNPWAQHFNNSFKSNSSSPPDQAGLLFGIDNTDDLQSKVIQKTKIIENFIIKTIYEKNSFEPKGMALLHQLKDELLSKLKSLAITGEELSTATKLYKELADFKITSLLNKYKSISIEEWSKDRGYAIIHGKAKAKIMGTIPWPGGVHSTVCLAPQCENMECHQGCTIKFTSEKGNNIFTECYAFRSKYNCRICKSNCSYKHHVHARFQLEWFENDSVLEAYNSIMMGADEALKKSKQLKVKADNLKLQYSQQLQEFSKLKNKFKNLAVLGDLRIILDSSKSTYQQQHEIAIQIEDQEKADNIQKIIDQLNSFIDTLNATEQDESYLSQQFNLIYNKSSEKFKQLTNIIFKHGVQI